MAHPLPSQITKTCTDGMMYCFSLWAKEVTLGAYWIFALLAFTAALFMATARFGRARAFAFSAFAGMMGSIFLAVLGLVTWWIASIFIIGGALGLAIMVMVSK